MKIERLVLITFICLFSCGVSFGAIQAAGWRGIVPLRSSKAEVERILGGPDANSDSSYRSSAEWVIVKYADRPCAGSHGSLYGWNVPAATVLSFTVTPDNPIALDDATLDTTKYVKVVETPSEYNLFNEKEGVRYRVQSDFITNVTYLPSPSDSALRCADFPPYSSVTDIYRIFDNFIVSTEEGLQNRLDDLAYRLLTDSFGKAYIIVYAGPKAESGEGAKMAAFALNYLVRKRKIPVERVQVMVGGFREAAQYDIFLLPKDWKPPVPTPTIGPPRSRRAQRG